MQTKNAIGNLINRYRAVLKKCNLLNTFGTLAIASAMALSGANLASAVEFTDENSFTVKEKGENQFVLIDGKEAEKTINNVSVGAGGIRLGNGSGQAASFTDDTLFTIKTNDHAGYGKRAYMTSNDKVEIADGKTLRITQMLTLDGENISVVTKDGSGAGTLDVLGYLTVSRDSDAGQGADLSGVNVNVLSGKVGENDQHYAGGLMLDNQIKVKNLTFGEDSVIRAYEDIRKDPSGEASKNEEKGKYQLGSYHGDSKTFVDKKQINVADNGIVTFKGNNQIGYAADAEENWINISGGSSSSVVIDTVNADDTVDINRSLVIEGATLDIEKGTLVVNDFATASEFYQHNTDGNVISKADYEKLTAEEKKSYAQINTAVTAELNAKKAVTVSGGTLQVNSGALAKFEDNFNVSDGAVNVDGEIEAQNINITGGTVTVANGGILDANAAYAQSGGLVTVQKGGLLEAASASTVSGADIVLDIQGLAGFENGLTVSGNGVVIADNVEVHETSLNLPDYAKEANGILAVAKNQKVTLDGGTLALRGSHDFADVSETLTFQNNGTLAVQDVLTMTASSGNIGVANGTLQADKINIKGVEDKGDSDKVTVSQGKLITHHGFDGLAGIEIIEVSNGAELQFGEDIESDAEKAFFGTELASGTIEQDIRASGKVYIESGIWKFQDIIADSTAHFDMKGGDVTVKTLALNTNNSSVYSATLRADKVSLGTGSMTVSGFDNTYNGRGELHTKNLVLGNTGNLVIADNGLVNIVDGTIKQESSGKIQIKGGRLEADYEDLVSNSALNGVIDSSSTGGFLYLDNDNKGYTLDDITKIQGNNKFGVSISGQLNDGKGNAIDEINTDDLGKLTNGGILQNVTLNAEGKAVSFTAQDKILGVQNVALGDQTMTVGDGSNTSTVVIGSDLTGGEKASVDVKADSVLSFENFGQAGSGTIGVAVSGDGTMTTNGDYTATKAINIGGLDVAGRLTAAEITMASNGTLSVGSETSSGKLVADNVKLAGGSLLIDPAWGMASSEVAIEKLGDQAGAKEDEIILSVDGKIGVGQNSLLSVGVKDQTELYKALDFLGEKGLSEEGIKAAMYLGQSVTVEQDQAVLINGTLMNDGFINGDGSTGQFEGTNYNNYKNKVTVADGLLAVNAQGLQDEKGAAKGAAIVFEDTANGALTIGSDGQVLIMNAKAGTVDLVNGDDTSDLSGGTADTIKVANHLLQIANGGINANTGVVTIEYNEKNDVVGNLSGNLGSYLKEYVTSGEHNAFLEAALGQQGVSGAHVANSVESAAKAPMVIGTATTALGIAGQGADYAMARTSFAPRVAGAAAVAENGEYTNISAGDNMANGMNLWIMPMYQNNSADGFKSGLHEIAYDSDFYGVALGADYTWANSFRLGATLNMGSGSAESKGTAVYTENDYDSIGFGVYAGYMLGNLGLSADVNYTNVSNEITQNNVMALSADGDSEIWSVGARAEYKIATSAMDIIPHIGIRYSHVSMDDMNFGHFVTEADNANVWQMPIGVTFARDFATESGWNVKPSLDLAVIPAFGDTEMVQKARFAGVSGFASTETEIMDDVSGRAQLGIEASKGNFYMGLDYSYQGSSGMDSHGVQANFGFKF